MKNFRINFNAEKEGTQSFNSPDGYTLSQAMNAILVTYDRQSIRIVSICQVEKKGNTTKEVYL